MKLKPVSQARLRVTDLVGVLSDHPTAVVAGVAAGLAAATVLRIIRRVRRLMVSAAMLAVAGGASGHWVSELVHTVAGR